MSIKVITRVWDKSQHKGNTLLALLALADNANDDGYCWPGLDNIAQKTRVSRNTVIRCIQSLEETAELFAAHNRRHGNRYLIILDRDDDQIRQALIQYFKMDDNAAQSAIDTINGLRVKCNSDTFQNDTSEVNPSSHQKLHSCDTSEVNPSSQEPSLNRQDEPSKETLLPDEISSDDQPEKKPPTAHQAMFEAVCLALEINYRFATKSQKKVLGQTASEILGADGSPSEMAEFIAWLKRKAERENWPKKPDAHSMCKHWGDFKSAKEKYSKPINCDTPEDIERRRRAAMGFAGQTPKTLAMLEKIMEEGAHERD